jgi:hypothetical protein
MYIGRRSHIDHGGLGINQLTRWLFRGDAPVTASLFFASYIH